VTAEDHVERARAALVDFLRSQAEWRTARTQQWPEDPRNARSAEALNGLVAWIKALPDDDDRLSRLATYYVDDTYFFPVGDRSIRLASRYGFASPANPDRFIEAFLSLLLDEHTDDDH
jgi:hypothetical protein